MASTLPNPGERNSVAEHMTRLNMKLLQQRLDNARLQQSPQDVEESDGKLDPNKIRYHQSLLKRHELLERIKAVHGKNPGHTEHGNGPSERNIPVRPESLPQLRRQERREHTPLNSAREARNINITHETNANNNPQQPAWMTSSYPPYPPSMAYNQYPVVPPLQYPVVGATTILPVASSAPQQSHKSEYFDMMMLQNAQMHQLFMQQLLTQGLRPKEEQQTVVIEQQQPALPQQPQVITLPQNKRPRSKHHHHYAQLPAIANERSYQINHIQHIEERKPTPVKARTPERRQPSPPPQVIRRPRPLPATFIPEQKFQPVSNFPGSDALRKFRHIAYAAWFVSFLKIAARKRKEDDKFLFGIRLKEAVGALHKIYLNPDGNIYPLLRDNISPGATDLTLAFDPKQNTVLQELVYVIENIVYQMTDIMPRAGVLGTNRKAVVFEMLLEGKIYPNGYFWQMEKELMTFDGEGRITELNDEKSRILLIGMFLSRGLITTLLMKPLDYGMSSTLLDEIAESNLKLMASLLVYIVRKVSVPKNAQQILPIPVEMSRYLYNDEELQPLLIKIQQTIDYADEILRDWMKEYIRRLQAAKDV